eukprot:CAMPEP_0206313170 /NCGR_PEP_ID=MMETSP0106_2-20121207/14367_1 /ASSEMBLY_ACC=CAM_ASM_000206 /TAXON_ID=81532 /ORGANISM="Acanthoeca-like sp., Strain 10tr" /LENGTH=686 /DNA_ID=CAMNT_0053744493 /DNA_START=305 /DNA_END=2362 /DNA_ORIENTATION=-
MAAAEGYPEGDAAVTQRMSQFLPHIASLARRSGGQDSKARDKKHFTFTKQATMHDSVQRPLKIKVYANGNAHFEGKVLVVDKSRIHSIAHLIEYLYPRIVGVARVPVIKRIYDIMSRQNCTDMAQIENGREYAVAGYEKFRDVAYHGIKNRRTLELEYRRRRMQHETMRQERQLALQRKKVERARVPAVMGGATNGSRIQVALKNAKPKMVYFIRNGDERNKTYPMLLNHRNATNFNQLCQRVSSKLQLEAPCRWIYTMAGKPVESIRELEDGQTYVAVGRIAFKQVGYKAAVKPKRIVRTRNRLPVAAGAAPAAPNRMPALKHAIDMDANFLGKPPEARKRKTRQDSLVRMPDAERSDERQSSRITTYRITTHTGDVDNAGTDAKHVYVTLEGQDGVTNRRQLRDSEDAFRIGGVHTLEWSTTDVGPLVSVTLEHDNDGESVDSCAWFVEKVEILNSSKGASALPFFFWFERWISIDDGLVSTAPMTTKNSFEEAQLELLERRKQHLLGIDTFQSYEDVVAKAFALASDSKESKRQWKVVDVEGKGFVEATYLWSHIRDLFPELHLPNVLEHCFKRVFKVRNVTDASMAVKAGFRYYIAVAALSCQFFEAAGFPEGDFDHLNFSKEESQKLLDKLGVTMSDEDFENVYFKLVADNNTIPFHELMAYFSESTCPVEIAESQNKKKD